MSYFEQGGKLEGFNVKNFFSLVFLLTFSCVLHADGWLPESGESGSTTKAPNVVTTEYSADGLRIGGIANTRHNLTMSYANNSAAMDNYRNNYYEVCVYCHTPHGANSTVAAPLWNRTVAQRTYSLFYNENRQSPLDLKVSQPGPNSLTCLSCHDGATAIDSVINMPTQMIGEFRAGYNVAQETVVNNSFLDAWGDNLLNAGSPANAGDQGGGHAALGGAPSAAGSCMACHNATNTQQGSPSFESFTIGGYSEFTQGDTGLADDHPIGVKYPEKFGADVDYNEPVKLPRIAFFDRNSNGYPDTNEVRLYDSGDGYEVECGSCHDPHGIKVSGAQNDELIPSFLRMGRIDIDVESPANSNRSLVSANHGSSLCLTCHVK